MYKLIKCVIMLSLSLLGTTSGKLYELEPKNNKVNKNEISYTYSLNPIKASAVSVTKNERNEIEIMYDRKLRFKPLIVYIVKDKVFESIGVADNKLILSGLSDLDCDVILENCQLNIKERQMKIEKSKEEDKNKEELNSTPNQ